jgi:hypothetical protein
MNKVSKEKTKEYNDKQKEYRKNFYKEYYKKNREEIKKSSNDRYDKISFEKINLEIDTLTKDKFDDELPSEIILNNNILNKINILILNNKFEDIKFLLKNAYK